jgi:hypothetical protein
MLLDGGKQFTRAIAAFYLTLVNARRREMSIRINMYYPNLDVSTEKSITSRNPYATVNIPQ